MKQTITLILFCTMQLSGFLPIHGQVNQNMHSVTGRVVEAGTGEALPGVSVIIKGTTIGTVTNLVGEYTISVPGPESILVYSFIGMLTQEIEVGNQTNINVNLEADMIELLEVTAIGYGSTMKRDITGSLASISEEDFNNGIFASTNELMKGKLAGIRVTTRSGEPGSPLNVFIRGANSIRTDNNPLYVIDGMPVSDISYINPQDIASIDILKDASAAAVYGSRGANGVVLITTKKGSEGVLTLNYSGQTGISTLANKVDLLSGPEFIEVVAREIGAAGSDIVFDPNVNTDWQDESYQMGIKQSHNLSFHGGTEKNTYLISLNYLDEQGIMKQTGFTRFSGRANTSHIFLNDRLKVDLNFSAADQQRQHPFDPGFVGAVGSAMIANPTYPVHREGDFRGFFVFPLINSNNPALLRDIQTRHSDELSLVGNIQTEFNILPTLSYISNLGSERINNNYLARSFPNPSDISPRGNYNNIHTDHNNILVDNLLQYSLINPVHRLNVLLGHSYQKFKSQQSGFGTSILDEATTIDPIYNPGILTNLTSGGYYQENELQSFFSRIQYSLWDKYLLTASARFDGSSRFGDQNKYGFFPSFALAWRINEENFLKDIRQIDVLKLRIGWGVTGNQEIPNKVTRVAYTQSIGHGTFLSNENGIVQGVLLTRTANPNLKWETTSQVNLGLDFGLFSNYLSGSVDYFYKNTTDLLLFTTALQPTPVAETWVNMDANIINEGIELQLNWNIMRSANDGFQWVLSPNVSYTKNNIENLRSPIRTGILSGLGLSGVTVNKYINDYPLGGFWLVEHEGFDENGMSYYKDSNNDGVLNMDDEVYSGTALPKWVFGLTSGFSYRRWALNAVFDGVQGNKIYNNTANGTNIMGSVSRGYNIPKGVTQLGESVTNTAPASTRFLEDGSYIRLSNVSLNYNVNTYNIGWVSDARLFLTASNLFVLTNYSGYDPEVDIRRAVGGNTSFGIDWYSYPKSKSVMVGVNFSF